MEMEWLLRSMALTALITVSAPAMLSAEEKKTEEGFLLDEVAVTATKTERNIRDVPASVSVITKEDIEQQHVVMTDELLRNVVGVDVDSAGVGSTAMTNVRGIPGSFAGATTLVLIDGLPVEPTQVSRKHAYKLVSPADIESIEVVRGPASALYGPNAAGGVINIITNKDKGPLAGSLGAGYGSNNTYRTNFSYGGSVNDRFYFNIGADRYETSGYKPLPDFNSTPAPDKAWYPEGYYDLKGRDATDQKFNARIGFRPTADSDISLGFRYFDIDAAWLGGHPNYRIKTHGNIIDLGYRNRISDLIEVKAKLLRSDYNDHFTFDSNADNGDGSLALDESDRDNEGVWQGELQTDLHLLKGNTLTLGFSYNNGKYNYNAEYVSGGGSISKSKSEGLGVFLQDEHKFGDLVTVTLGGRYDRYKFSGDIRNGVKFPTSNDDVFTYRSGVRFNPAKETSLYASIGTAYLPALNNLKFRSGSAWLSNPDLKPESSISYEVGVDQWFGGFLKGTAALFYTDYHDKITAVTVGTKRQFQNMGKLEVKGVETSLEAVFADYWHPFANYTFTHSEITKNPTDPLTVGKRPAYTPEHKFNVGLTYDNPKIITARVAGRYVGSRYFNDRNTALYKTGSYFVVDAKVSKTIPVNNYHFKDVTLSLSVTNLFDKRYQQFWFENADGINVFGEVAVKF